jgi:hypothetical protein
LTDLLSSTIGAAPDHCPGCQPQPPRDSGRLSDLSSEAYAFR